MRLPREFYIPKGAAKVADKHSTAVAYLYENARGQIAAAMFAGKRAKPDRHYSYKDANQRAERVAAYFEAVQASEAAATERRKERTAAPRGLEVGDIVNTCWGYDQTNREFYQVTALIGSRMVELREIAQRRVEDTGFCSWTTVPERGDFIGEAFRANARNGTVKAGPRRAYHASKWSGDPLHASNGH